MTNPDTDAHWMQLALAQARLAADAGEVPVGAVVVKNGQLLATGRNAPIAGHDPTAHAEIVALRAAARALGNYRLDGCSLYVTLEPCAMCSGAMLHARLARVVYGAPDAKTGAAGGLLDLFAQPGLNHQTQVTGGVLADVCAAELQAFFKPRRVNAQPLREDALRTPEQRFAGLHPPGLAVHSIALDANTPWPGLRLQVSDTGAGPAAVLALHGPWGWGRDAQALALALQARGVRAVLPDLPGFGRSDKPKKAATHTVQAHRDSVWAVVQGLQLRRVVVVVPQVPSAMALAHALQTWQPHIFEQVVAWWPDEPSAQPCSTQDAPFPDAGHRAAQRAWAQWPTGLDLPTTWVPVHLRGAMARWAAPVWARWGGATPQAPAALAPLDEAGLAALLARFF